MNIKEIEMPKGCQFMREYENYLLSQLQSSNKFILDKSVPGCGGTTMFLEADFPVVIISPRTNPLLNKKAQHSDAFLFHIPYTNGNKRAEEIQNKMSELRVYLTQHSPNQDPRTTPPKVLVTLDSADKVLDVIKSMKIVKYFLFVVDEFQCLLGDANFKGTVDMNFLSTIDSEVTNLCYLSATPLSALSLEAIPQFTNVEYYKLKWDPDVMQEPTIRSIQMKKGDSVEKICAGIISNFNNNGYFARKVVSGNIAESKEVCIFVNQVSTIVNIINKNNLKPEDVTILCSESNSSKLPPGFKTGGLCTDKHNRRNKTYTFCTKASFEGVDFYSNNATTYIFIDGTKQWQTLDIFIDIPQILGRQRCEDNPFRHDATVYFRTSPTVESEAEFIKREQAMEAESQKKMTEFNKLSNDAKEMCIYAFGNIKDEAQFKKDYIDVFTQNGSYTLGINHLVKAARWNYWYMKSYFYNNKRQLVSGLISAVKMKQKPDGLKRFEEDFYKAAEAEQLKKYSEFRYNNRQYNSLLLENPFIRLEYHDWFDKLGYDTLKCLNFDEKQVEREYDEHINIEPIRKECQQAFQPGMIYSSEEVKSRLQAIYEKLGLHGKVAKATELENYMSVQMAWYKKDDGKKGYGYKLK